MKTTLAIALLLNLASAKQLKGSLKQFDLAQVDPQEDDAGEKKKLHDELLHNRYRPSRTRADPEDKDFKPGYKKYNTIFRFKDRTYPTTYTSPLDQFKSVYENPKLTPIMSDDKNEETSEEQPVKPQANED